MGVGGWGLGVGGCRKQDVRNVKFGAERSKPMQNNGDRKSTTNNRSINLPGGVPIAISVAQLTEFALESQ